MGRIKTWIMDEANRKLLVWLVVSIGGLLGYFGIYKPGSEKPAPVANQTATANGGNAVNASGSAVVSVGAAPASAPVAALSAAPASAPTPLGAVVQSASASNGIAVNAAGGSQVVVKP